MTKKEFSNRLKSLRDSKNITQATMSIETGIKPRIYVYYETESRPILPSCKNLIALADYFGCATDYLLCRTDNPEMMK